MNMAHLIRNARLLDFEADIVYYMNLGYRVVGFSVRNDPLLIYYALMVKYKQKEMDHKKFKEDTDFLLLGKDEEKKHKKSIYVPELVHLGKGE